MKDYFEELDRLYEEALNEVRKEDDLYLIGPFWIIGNSLEEINNGDFKVIAEKFLINWDGEYQHKVTKSEFTHKGIWATKYKNKYGVEYNYYPRGRISFNNQAKEFCINVPKGLNEELVLPKIASEYGINVGKLKVKYTDPTSGDHYTFSLT